MGRNIKKMTKEYSEAVTKLREQLPDNGIVMVAERCGKSKEMVGMALNLKRYPSEKIVKAAMEIVKEYKEKERALAEEIQNVIDE